MAAGLIRSASVIWLAPVRVFGPMAPWVLIDNTEARVMTSSRPTNTATRQSPTDRISEPARGQKCPLVETQDSLRLILLRSTAMTGARHRRTMTTDGGI